MKFDKSKLPSRHVSTGVKSAPHRSMYYAMGLKNEDIEKVIKELSVINKIFVVTMGEKGVVLVHKKEIIKIPSEKVEKIIDLTGAGDLFAAGFLHGYINNLTISESLEKGTEMSTKVIQQIGARL